MAAGSGFRVAILILLKAKNRQPCSLLRGRRHPLRWSNVLALVASGCDQQNYAHINLMRANAGAGWRQTDLSCAIPFSAPLRVHSAVSRTRPASSRSSARWYS